REGADHKTTQRALARRGGTDDGHQLARLHLEADVANDNALACSERNVVQYKVAPRRRKFGALAIGYMIVQARFQAPERNPRSAEIPPGRHGDFDGRERATEQNGRSDHRTRAEIAMDDEIGAYTKNRDLREEANELGTANKNAATFCRPIGCFHR